MKQVVVNDRMQRGYVYWRTEPAGRNFAPGFTPELTPKQLLRLGVFGGKYMTDCRKEFPATLVCRRPAVRRTARQAPELFRRERVAVAGRLASQRMDPPAGSARLVSVVLPLLHGPAQRRRCAANSKMACDQAARDRDSNQLRTRRPRVPQNTASGLLHWAYDSRKI